MLEAQLNLWDTVFSRFSFLSDDINILDVSSGCGFQTYKLKQRFPDANITGLDIGKEEIEVAKVTYEQDGLDYIQADAQTIEKTFGDKRFDGILNVEAGFHYPQRRKFYEQARNLLNPGGTLVICDILPNDRLLERKDCCCGFSKVYGESIIGLSQSNMDIGVSQWKEELLEIFQGNVEFEDITKNTFEPFYTWSSQNRISTRRGNCCEKCCEKNVFADLALYHSEDPPPFYYMIAVCTSSSVQI